jgi:hypothetical protein
MVSVKISKSTSKGKKLMAVFTDDNGKKIKTTHFGAAGAKDFTLHSPADRDARKKAYLIRHRKREDWSKYMTPGSLSRYILWDKTTRAASIASYKRRFGLK